MPTLRNEMINAARLGFEEQKRRVDQQITELRALLSGPTAQSIKSPESVKNPRRRMSAAGKKAIADAQRKRWAEQKANSTTAPTKTAKPATKKRGLTAAGKEAIVSYLKKHWAA